VRKSRSTEVKRDHLQGKRPRNPSEVRHLSNMDLRDKVIPLRGVKEGLMRDSYKIQWSGRQCFSKTYQMPIFATDQVEME